MCNVHTVAIAISYLTSKCLIIQPPEEINSRHTHGDSQLKASCCLKQSLKGILVIASQNTRNFQGTVRVYYSVSTVRF